MRSITNTVMRSNILDGGLRTGISEHDVTGTEGTSRLTTKAMKLRRARYTIDQ